MFSHENIIAKMNCIENINMMRLEKTAKALRNNNMDAFIASDRAEARRIALELLPDGCIIASGGTETAKECGLLEDFRSGKYSYIDRDGVSPENIQQIYRKSFCADFYFTSANAITENGELYNVDGNSNRIAAIAYGPTNVIVIAGVNKIVKDLKAAQVRVKSIAAPANAIRLGIESYCSKTGECVSLKCQNSEMSEGCPSDSRICCNYLISARQRIKGRIKVILVNESLGF